MNTQDAIKRLEDFIQADRLTYWGYAGDDYKNQMLAAEDSLECLLGHDSIRNIEEAMAFAQNLSCKSAINAEIQ